MIENMHQMFNMMMPSIPIGKPVEYAQAYIPDQHYSTSYPPPEALEKGTMFPELDKPWAYDDRRVGMWL